MAVTPLLFAYGTLQQENVQLSTLGRRLNGEREREREREELLRFERSFVKIDDPEVVVALGKDHHANVRFNGKDDSRVPGMVFEITEAELTSIDEYEVAFFYKRVAALLGSGKQAWVYVDAHSLPDGS